MKSTGISSCITRRGRSRGFTLTELAIVLGVTGVIMGGIWAYAAEAWENSRQSTLKNNMAAVVRNMQAFYAGRAGVTGTLTLTPQLIVSNVIPGDMTRSGGSCNNTFGTQTLCADHPWGTLTANAGQKGSFRLCGWVIGTTASCTAGTATTAPYFAIELESMPVSSCVKALLLNTGADAPPGFYDVYVNGTSMLGLNDGFPVLASDAYTNCKVTSPANVDFIYRLTAPQS